MPAPGGVHQEEHENSCGVQLLVWRQCVPEPQQEEGGRGAIGGMGGETEVEGPCVDEGGGGSDGASSHQRPMFPVQSHHSDQVVKLILAMLSN